MKSGDKPLYELGLRAVSEISYFIHYELLRVERQGTRSHIAEDICNPINISVKVVNDTRALIRIISSVRCLSCGARLQLLLFSVIKNDARSIRGKGAGAWPNICSRFFPTIHIISSDRNSYFDF